MWLAGGSSGHSALPQVECPAQKQWGSGRAGPTSGPQGPECCVRSCLLLVTSTHLLSHPSDASPFILRPESTQVPQCPSPSPLLLHASLGKLCPAASSAGSCLLAPAPTWVVVPGLSPEGRGMSTGAGAQGPSCSSHPVGSNACPRTWALPHSTQRDKCIGRSLSVTPSFLWAGGPRVASRVSRGHTGSDSAAGEAGGGSVECPAPRNTAARWQGLRPCAQEGAGGGWASSLVLAGASRADPGILWTGHSRP